MTTIRDDTAFVEIYTELRSIARRERARGPEATLNTTAIVHEAWLKLKGRRKRWNDRDHYVGTAALAMRQVVMDYARYRIAGKRDARKEVPIFENAEQEGAAAEELLAIDQALDQLEQVDARLAELVSLRYFAGLPLDQAAEVLDISIRTASREWAKARAFLRATLQ